MYKVNVPRFARQLMPPLLRSPQMMAIVDAMVSGVKHVQTMFYAMRGEHIDALRTNAHVIVLEYALNKSVRLNEGPIHLTVQEEFAKIMYSQHEDRPLTMGLMTESHKCYITLKGERIKSSITMHVPNTIATSLNPDEDEYRGRYLSILRNVMDRYVPISKNYTINIYNY